MATLTATLRAPAQISSQRRSDQHARTERHIPYARIQNIVQLRNPLHRLFGVTELRLESGGGAKPEAVMKVIRVADAQRLEQVLRGTPAHAATDAPAHEPRTLLSLATSDVLLLGLLNNRGAIVLGAAVGGLFQFQWWEKDQVREMFKLPGVVLHDLAAPAHLLGWMWTIALLVAGVFLLLKLFSVAVSLTTFFGFRLVRDGDRVATESGLDPGTCGQLVQVAHAARRLKGHGLDEGVSTRLLVYAATLVQCGLAPREACRMAMVRPITDDADIRDTLGHAIDAVFG